jgi:hypothetical protein
MDNNTADTKIPKTSYLIKTFSGLVILGILIKFIFANVTSDYAKATVAGYSFTLFALFCLTISTFVLAMKTQINKSIKGFFTDVFSKALPLIVVTIIISLVLSQNIIYYDNINENRVSSEFYQYSNVLSVLIVFQCILVLYYLMNFLNNNTRSNTQLFYSLVIVSILNFILITINEVILKFFSTDG